MLICPESSIGSPVPAGLRRKDLLWTHAIVYRSHSGALPYAVVETQVKLMDSMDRERFKLIPEVHLLLFRKEDILLLRRYNTGYEDGKYGLIAGHVDGNETLTEAMRREAKEEAGIEVMPENLRFAHLMHRRHLDERISVFYVADRWHGEPRNMEPDRCDEMGWFSLSGLPENMVPYVREAIMHHRAGTMYAEFGWNGNAQASGPAWDQTAANAGGKSGQ